MTDVVRPELGADPRHNAAALQSVLRPDAGGVVEIPPGEHPVSRGLTVPAGWTVRGASGNGAGPASWLVATETDSAPLLSVTGSAVAVRDLGLRPAPCDPGEHGGDRGTAITIGRYLYDEPPEWISRVTVERVEVDRPGDRAANSIAVMGAVRQVSLRDVAVRGGYTGVAVHWGAVGGDVTSITGPSYHPNALYLAGLRVRDAVEGFYLSSVYDVRLAGACLSDVEIGFRLLPGDNTDRFSRDPDAAIGQRIDVSDVCVTWTGDRYGARIAGWGRSEIDGSVSVLRYADAVVRDCVLRRILPDGAEPSPGSWAPVLVEQAAGMRLNNVRVDTGATRPCCALAAGQLSS